MLKLIKKEEGDPERPEEKSSRGSQGNAPKPQLRVIAGGGRAVRDPTGVPEEELQQPG